MTLDHIVPLSKGGCDKRSNHAAACAPCNQAKADMDAREFNPNEHRKPSAKRIRQDLEFREAMNAARAKRLDREMAR